MAFVRTWRNGVVALGMALLGLTAAAQAPLSRANLESFYVGTLHLGFAAARASCFPGDQAPPGYVIELIRTDLASARDGARALSSCVNFDLGEFDRVAANLGSLRTSDIQASITRLYQSYQQALRQSNCALGGSGNPPPSGGTGRLARGRLLGAATLPGERSQPTDTGVYLEAGRSYFVVGEGSVSLWDGQDDGCDSVYRYRTPMEDRGGPLVIWGQLKLFLPSPVYLSGLIEKQTGRKAVYNPGHVYEALVSGEGATLKAVVFDGGGYGDNHGALRVSVYEAVPEN